MKKVKNKHSEGVIRRCKDIHRQVDTTITERRVKERERENGRNSSKGGGERTNGNGGGNCMAVNGRVGSDQRAVC